MDVRKSCFVMRLDRELLQWKAIKQKNFEKPTSVAVVTEDVCKRWKMYKH